MSEEVNQDTTIANTEHNEEMTLVSPQFTLYDLPSELLYRISTFLDLRDFLVFGYVCHLFNDVSHENASWAQFFRERFCIPRNLKNALDDIDLVSWKQIYTNAQRSYNYWSTTEKNLVKDFYTLNNEEDNFGIWSLQYIGNKLVAGAANGEVRVWSLETKKSTAFISGTRDMRGIGVMFTDQFLARGTSGGIVDLYKWNDDDPFTLSEPVGKFAMSRPSNRYLPVLTCLWFDSERFITSTGAGLQLWDLSVNMVNQFPIEDTRWFQPLLYQNETVICGTNRGFLAQKDFRSKNICEALTKAHNDSIWKVECFGSGRGENMVASSGGDCMVCVFDIRTWKPLYTIDGHDSLVGDVVTDESRILTCANDGKIQVSDIVDGHLLHSVQTADNIRTFVWCIQFDHDKIVSGNTEGVVVIHSITRDVNGDRDVFEPPHGGERRRSCILQ
eukprot:TRINITY_DN3652_c0_g5_i3.p1 TRINITY_DN3652_c0_g5~~TRINITY_DN3652_c0_g5_i3.p1  ORF type:complete len:444 (+),score=64.06 TRINITY_DN3652_c0_g5_i3:538-1869(+)